MHAPLPSRSQAAGRALARLQSCVPSPSPPTIGDRPDYTEEAADIEEAISGGEEMEEGTYNVSMITALA